MDIHFDLELTDILIRDGVAQFNVSVITRADEKGTRRQSLGRFHLETSDIFTIEDFFIVSMGSKQ